MENPTAGDIARITGRSTSPIGERDATGRRNRRLHGSMLLTLAMLLLVIACSDAGDPAAPPPQPPAVASVTIQPDTLTLTVGQSHPFSAIARAADGAVLGNRPTQWTTANDSIVTVDGTGNATARRSGIVLVTATVEGKAGQTRITVRPLATSVARIEPTTGGVVTLHTGQARQLGVRAFAEDGSEITGRPVSWTSNNSSVADVSPSGVVQARAVGNAIVTAEVEGKTADVSIDVRSLIVRIDMDPPMLALGTGEDRAVTATPRGEGNIVLNRPLTWTSTNDAVATVDAAGTVTAHSPGTAVIKASAEGVDGRTDVTVVAWTERELLAINDSAPPATLFTRPWTDATGVTHPIRVVALQGSMRLAMLGVNSGRYRLEFWVRIIREGQPEQIGGYVNAGEWHYNVVAGTYTLISWNGQTMTATPQPGGRLQVTGRLEEALAPVRLLYSVLP